MVRLPWLFFGPYGAAPARSATMALAMVDSARRDFLRTASAATFAAMQASSAVFATPPRRLPHRRVLVASHGDNGILSFDWDPVKGELSPLGLAARIPQVAWLACSRAAGAGWFIYSASELDAFNGRPTGEVASFLWTGQQLQPLSARNSAGAGTCHAAVDATGQMLVSVDYTGGSAASFRIEDGKLSEAVWTERYLGHGPNIERQEKAHAHFASFSPDNRFAYINDLGGDVIHIYKTDPATAGMTSAGVYRAAPGSGPRTLHFIAGSHFALGMNELNSTVDVLDWDKNHGSLQLVDRIDLLPAGYTGPTRGCDTVISSDERFVYFANRDNNFLYAFKLHPAQAKLTPMKRSSCGGKTPRHFTLDPSERWMLVANQDSNQISIFARDPRTGALADEGRSVEVEMPMRILFV